MPCRRPFRTAALTAVVVSMAMSVPASAAVPRSQDDRGFSIALVSPSDPYLVGRQTVRVEPIIPRGDVIEQVDFFVDGRLVFVVHHDPWACDTDFGTDIRRHIIDVRALTRDGRRAKVSFVSRSIDVSEEAAGPVVSLAAVVRNPAGRPVPLLGVSDFVLSENGERRPIVHFIPGPSPASVALTIDGKADAVHPQEAVAAFLRDLPEHQAVAIVEDRPSPGAEGTVFEVQTASLAARIRAEGLGGAPGPIDGRVATAAAALAQRRGPRVLVVLTALDPPVETIGPLPGPGDLADTGPEPGAQDAPQPPADPLDEALQAALQAHAVVYVAAVGTEASRVPQSLRHAADQSGGQFLLAPDLAALGQALHSVAEALRHRYLLTYMPGTPGAEGWRSIELGVQEPDLIVQAPHGIFMP
jgi:hypothetical protein